MVRIGKIVASQGLKGSMVMTHILDSSNWLKKEDVLFLELQKQSYIPFFITQIRTVNDEEYILSLEEIDTVEAAKKLISKQVYVEEAVLEKAKVSSPLLWIGYTAIDKEHGNLGLIEDVMFTGTQWLGQITYKDKEALIPFIEQTIQRIDTRKKTIFLNLPEGLLDVYA